MKLEDEARIFNRTKDCVFVEKLTALCADVDNLAMSYLHPSKERDMMEQKLREVRFWGRYCSDRHGTK